MTEEQENLYQLIETWDDNNIDLALQLLKGNKELDKSTKLRYQETLDALKRKTIKSLKNMPKKWDGASQNTKLLLLDVMPVKEGSVMHQKMEAFCKTVKEVNFYNKGLKTIPDSIYRFPNLRKISATQNLIKKVDPNLFGLEKLEELHLKNNKIVALPASSAEAKQLQKIHLDNNELTALPTLAKEAVLTQFTATHNKIKAISADFCQAAALEFLYLQSNEIQSIDAAVSNLTKLKVLNLANNQLKELPETIGQLEHLETLNLVGNQLEKMPASIANLASIKYIWIWDNPIAEDEKLMTALQEKMPNCKLFYKKMKVMPLR